MTGDDVKAIREELGRYLGQRLSQRDLGIALGLTPENADRGVRKWEDEGPTGPAAVALQLMRGIVANDYEGARIFMDSCFDR